MICAEYDNDYQLHEIAKCLLLRMPWLYLLCKGTLCLERDSLFRSFGKIKILVEIRASITCINLNNTCYADFYSVVCLLNSLNLST